MLTSIDDDEQDQSVTRLIPNACANPTYKTHLGAAYCSESLRVLQAMPNDSVDLILTSPPFALSRPKEYGNQKSGDYVAWLKPFAIEFMRIMKESASLVIELGGAWERGVPFKSIYQYKVLIDLCEMSPRPFHLAQDFFWYNDAKLPTPANWVNIKRLRVKDAVSTIWWLVKSESAKADNRNVLIPYSEGMKRLLATTEYNRGQRPSGHRIGEGFLKANGGAIPANLIQSSNTNSSDPYLHLCRNYGVTPHPARFPAQIPTFFIKLLTDKDDVVLDPFAGSNVTGFCSHTLHRRWISIEQDQSYVEGSKFRFATFT